MLVFMVLIHFVCVWVGGGRVVVMVVCGCGSVGVYEVCMEVTECRDGCVFGVWVGE